MADFLFELDSREKFECPDCHHQGCFVKYKNTSTGKYLDGGFGRCDRENNCGYHKKPTNNKPMKFGVSAVVEETPSIFDCDIIPDEIYNEFHVNPKKLPNTFLRSLVDRYGRERVMPVYEKYRLGTWLDGSVVFPYLSEIGLHTGKIMWYDKTMHRIKDGRKAHPQWLHNADYAGDDGYAHYLKFDGKHPIPFFGSHLLQNLNKRNQTICLVEAEKTAVIMAIEYPEMVWIASGGLQNISTEKFNSFQNANVLIFPDMGIVKMLQMTVRDFWEFKISTALSIVDFRYSFVEYIPKTMPILLREKWEEQGKDVVDFIFDYDSKYFEDEFSSYHNYLVQAINKAKSYGI